ncbi:unnamed protein product [Rotaria sp. Silwood2]|nr:unnamed protein product [Rotaria sp. Silwood2]
MAATMSLNSSMNDIESIHCRENNLPIVKQRRLTNETIHTQDSSRDVLPTNDVILKRNLGSGIFVSPKGVLRGTESVGLCLIIWIASGLVSLLGALCYAEIGTVIPRNGAEIAYMKEGIGSVHERIGEILAYLFNWTSALILKPSSVAILALTFSQYFLSDCSPSEELIKITAILAIRTTRKPLGVALAFYSGLWAYDGWNSLNSITEELKNPQRNLWLSIVLALPSVIVLYLLTNISYFTVMSKEALLSSNAVAVTWGEIAIGPVVRALPILISISALGSGNGSLFSSARYCMVGAQYGYLPEVFACIHKHRLTPVPGIVLEVGLIAIALCLPSNVEGLIDFFSFTAWIFYGLTFLATLFCKFTMKRAERVISIPIPLIIIIILISIYLVFAPVIADPSIGFLVAFLIVLFGLIFYYPFVYRKIELNIISM